ncbi:MAG: FMN-binding protein [Streptosporangiaceae bacterium]
MKGNLRLVLAGTVIGFAGVLGLHNGAPRTAASGAPPTPGPPTSSRPTAIPSGPAPRRAKTSAPSRPARATSYRSATGAVEQFGYGSIAVRVIVEGNRITGVSVAALRTLEPTSQQISTQAIPVLRAEVLSAQSAAISGVSGATYTSQGYSKSLQAALNELHVK